MLNTLGMILNISNAYFQRIFIHTVTNYSKVSKNVTHRPSLMDRSSYQKHFFLL
ncbi:hypothetical protein SAMN04487865_10521 [Succinivibrio dextrinosolvens]|uniref:Uncharacterized protein n=1 Tax=Succinivibrio dextrinosolvens TaxID=83771 RepID=A0A662ZEU8_9GAMM|nr:hypothetical protein SAMN04487865_10521 [Succinivibrio dextrinosolvens]